MVVCPSRAVSKLDGQRGGHFKELHFHRLWAGTGQQQGCWPSSAGPLGHDSRPRTASGSTRVPVGLGPRCSTHCPATLVPHRFPQRSLRVCFPAFSMYLFYGPDSSPPPPFFFTFFLTYPGGSHFPFLLPQGCEQQQ